MQLRRHVFRGQPRPYLDGEVGPPTPLRVADHRQGPGRDHQARDDETVGLLRHLAERGCQGEAVERHARYQVHGVDGPAARGQGRPVAFPEDVDDWDFGKALGVLAEAVTETWGSAWLTDEFVRAKPVPRGLEELARHIAAGDDIIFVTARGCLPMEAHVRSRRHDDGLEWLVRHVRPLGLDPAGRTHFTADKLPVLRDFGAELMYDDSPSGALHLAEAGIPVIMPVYAYNAHVTHPNITRAEGWHSW